MKVMTTSAFETRTVNPVCRSAEKKKPMVKNIDEDLKPLMRNEVKRKEKNAAVHAAGRKNTG